VYGGDLIAAGGFTQAGNNANTKYIGRFNGSGWFGLAGGMDSNVNALFAMDMDLIAGGAFRLAGGTPVVFVAGWNGTAWYPLGGGMNDHVRSLSSYAGELVAGGWFTAAEGTPAGLVARWDGTSWSNLGVGLGGAGPPGPVVSALAEFNGDLYAGGRFDIADGAPVTSLARWDGASWSGFGTTLTPTGNSNCDPVEALSTDYGGVLIVGGDFSHVNGVYCNGLASWDGSTWIPLGVGLDPNAAVLDVTVYHGELVVFGYLSVPGGSSMIARWDGVSWGSFGSGLVGWDLFGGAGGLAVVNGNLFAGGNISMAGDKLSMFISRWTDPGTGVEQAQIGSGALALRLSNNPALGAAGIRCSIDRGARVLLEVLDVGGRRVVTLDDGWHVAGALDTWWSGRFEDGSIAPSGVYFVRLTAEDRSVVEKLVLLR
jgi:hypothetical protein